MLDRRRPVPGRPPHGPARRDLTLLLACLGFFVLILDTTVVNVALPQIGDSVGGGVSGLQWVVDGYSLVLGALVLSSGSYSDRVGAAAAYAQGLAIFTVSSLVCVVAPNLAILLGARALQGLSAALMLPSSLALATQTCTDAKGKAQAIALWSTAGGVAVAAGPVVGGLCTSAFGWRSVFLINVPVTALLLLGMRTVPASAKRTSHLDLRGQAAAILSLTGLTFGVIEGARTGYSDVLPLTSFALAVVGAVLFAVIELHVPAPAVPLRQLDNRTAKGILTIGVAMFFGFYGVVFTLSLYFQDVLGYGPARSGLMFLPMTALIAVSTLNVARWVHRTGPWMPLTAGLLLTSAGLLLMLLLDEGSSPWLIALGTLPVGVGAGLSGPCLAMVLVSTLPEQAGVASGISNAVRQGSASLGVAVFGALFSGGTGFVTGMHRAFAISAVAQLVAVVLAVTFVRPALPARTRRQPA